jgi:NAD(P)-dependent dehydrogenase (short-subunit alcohol dehydrogenase family)
MMPGRFDSMGALVTGAASGIGKATAIALAAEGARVLAVGHSDEDGLKETVRAIESAGGSVVQAFADITVEADVARVVAEAVEQFRRLDVAVNCAGLPSWGLAAEMDLSEWERTVAVNLTGTWLCMKHEISQMRLTNPASGGAVVNVASRIGAHMRVAHQSAYASSKAAVAALTRSAAREYIGEGIRINAVSPGPTLTAMALFPGETPRQRDARIQREVPAGRMARPEEIANAVLWLASSEAAFVVGHDLVIDGGMTA